MNNFFVNANGATESPSSPQLGHFRRACSRCDREWQLGQPACTCGSHEFAETYLEGTLLERVGGRIMAAVIPAKAKAPSATSAHKAALRGVREGMAQLLTDLRQLDVQLREAVVADVVELQPAQALVNLALSITGDRSTQRIAGLSLSLESLHAALATTIEQLEDTPK